MIRYHRSFPRTVILLSVILLGIAMGSARVPMAVGEEGKDNDYFRQQVKPILVDRCLECHGSDRKGELDLRSRESLAKGGASGGVIEPGDPNASLLIDYVEAEEMPPGDPLSSEEIQALRKWIADGAEFPDKPLDEFADSSDERAGYDWWALQPLSAPAPPETEGLPQSWSRNPIDRFIYQQLSQRGLEPSEPADRRALIRRATYDLTGLPPTPDEVAAFEQDDRPDAYARLVDRLLASPHYGEHWGRHWLDVVRFGESNGFERNQIIDNAWPFRDYVIRSLNEDKPFDQLVKEHLAGDVMAPDDPDSVVGTTFLVCGPYDDVGNQDPVQAAQIRANTIDDMIRATSETFLGLTVGCARCHNHKFDPVSQADYYSLYATFAGVRHGSRIVATPEQRKQHVEALAPLQEKQGQIEKELAELERTLREAADAQAASVAAEWTRPPIDRRGVEELFDPVQARYVRLRVDGTDTNPEAGAGFRIDEFEVWTDEPAPRNVALSSAGAQATGMSRVAEDFNEAYAATLAIDGMFGAPWIASGPELTITLSQPETIYRVFFSSDRTGAAGDQPIATFVGEYELSVSIDGETWQTVATSQDRQPVSDAHRRKRLTRRIITEPQTSRRRELNAQLHAIKQQIAGIKPLPQWWIGNFESADGPFHVFVGGSPQRSGDEVLPSSLSALEQAAGAYELEATAAESERRRRLAEWIVAPENPLTPRVLANRIWHYHFGTGIVATPSDFGFMGARPTHPQLLDWLAGKLLESRWRIKSLHRLIMMSQTYRQSSRYDASAAAVDADGRYLWRFPPRRLSAEEIRDTVLCVAGQLNRERGGPGFRLYHYMQDNVATYVPLDEFGPETYRRSVYHQNARATRIDLMTEFDAPDCAFATPRRVSTTTPLQALTMMNHSFTVDMARAIAERAEQSCRAPGQKLPSDAELVGEVFRLVYARQPAAEERRVSEALVREHGLPALCRALLNTNEFIYVD